MCVCGIDKTLVQREGLGRNGRNGSTVAPMGREGVKFAVDESNVDSFTPNFTPPPSVQRVAPVGVKNVKIVPL